MRHCNQKCAKTLDEKRMATEETVPVLTTAKSSGKQRKQCSLNKDARTGKHWYRPSHASRQLGGTETNHLFYIFLIIILKLILLHCRILHVQCCTQLLLSIRLPPRERHRVSTTNERRRRKKWLEDKISTLKTILSLTSGGIYSANAYNDDACRTGSLACVAQS